MFTPEKASSMTMDEAKARAREMGRNGERYEGKGLKILFADGVLTVAALLTEYEHGWQERLNAASPTQSAEPWAADALTGRR